MGNVLAMNSLQLKLAFFVIIYFIISVHNQQLLLIVLKLLRDAHDRQMTLVRQYWQTRQNSTRKRKRKTPVEWMSVQSVSSNSSSSSTVVVAAVVEEEYYLDGNNNNII